MLDALAADLRAHAPQVALVTGDFTQLAQPEEFHQAAAWLATVSAAFPVLGVPGNHDAYVVGAWASGAHEIGAWIPGYWPWTRRLDPVTLLGVSSASPTAPWSAGGRLGPDQLARLETALAAARGTLRVLLIHHPPRAGTVPARKALADAEALRTVLARTGVELVLHGHGHRRARGWLAAGAGRAFVSGVPSASADDPRPARRAAYDLYAVQATAGGWRLERAERVWDGARLVWGERATLELRPT